MAMQSGFIKRIRDIMRMDAGINGDAQRIEQMVWMLFLKVYDAKEDDWELNEDNYESIIPEDLRWRNWAKADENGHAMTGDKLLSFVNNTLFPVLKGNDVKESDTVLYSGINVTPDTPIKKAIVKSTFITTNILFFDHTKPTEETWFYRLDMPEGYKNFSKTKPMELKHFDPAMDWWNNREEINVDGFDKAKKYTAEEIAARNYNIDLCGYPHEEEEILPPKELIQQYQEKRASLNADIDRILAQITEILGIDLEGE